MLRRIKTVLLSGLIALVLPAAVAVAPSRIVAGTVHQPLYDIAFDGVRGMAVGADGRVLASIDSGKTWRNEKPATTASLLGVALRGTHSIVIGQAGLILTRTGDAGWRTVKVDSTERLLGIDMNSTGVAAVVGGFGTILISTDFGETWVKTVPDWPAIFSDHADTLGPAFAPHLYGVSVGEQGEIRVVGELSVILATNAGSLGQGSKAWRLVNRGDIVDGKADASLFGIHMRADGTGFAFGQSGRVLRTADGGMHWMPIDTGTQAILLAAETGKPGHIVLVGIRELLSSDDDGLHWQHHGSSPETANGWFVAAAKPDPSNGIFIVGEAGKILSIPD